MRGGGEDAETRYAMGKRPSDGMVPGAVPDLKHARSPLPCRNRSVCSGLTFALVGLRIWFCFRRARSRGSTGSLRSLRCAM